MTSKKDVSVDETKKENLSTKIEIDVDVDETIVENFKMSKRRNENMTTREKRENDDDDLSILIEIVENDDLSILTKIDEEVFEKNFSTTKNFFSIIDLKSL